MKIEMKEENFFNTLLETFLHNCFRYFLRIRKKKLKLIIFYYLLTL